MSAASIPFGENNPATRNIFSCGKSKQAVSFPFYNKNYRSDTKSQFLLYPQKPLISTSVYDDYNWNENPLGTNMSIAVISYSGFDMEDAVVFNKASIDRGLVNDLVYKTVIYDFEDLTKELDCGLTDLQFTRDPDDPHIFLHLDEQGLPHIGNIVRHNFPVLSVCSTKSQRFLIKKYTRRNPAYIDSVKFMGVSANSSAKQLPKETKKVSITYRLKRIPEIGDKFSNRHGQKGVCGTLLMPEDLPFSESGFIPDILFNPHGLPSRMSIGMLLEMLMSKTALFKETRADWETGKNYTVVPFEFSEDETAVEVYGDLLRDAGFEYYGTEKFYSGTSGEELEADVFCGFVYYFRLNHVVDEKFQVQAVGSDVDPKTMQPLNNDRAGAIRFGEMERDAILSHGAMELSLDRLLHNSDKCMAFLCSTCRTLINAVPPYPELEEFPRSSIPCSLLHQYCRACDSTQVHEIQIPYVFAYLVAELAIMGIKITIRVND